MACTAQYHKDADLSNLPDWQTNRLNLFYGVFIAGLVTVIILFVSFLFDLDKRCESPRGWRFFVSTHQFCCGPEASYEMASIIYTLTEGLGPETGSLRCGAGQETQFSLAPPHPGEH